MTKYANPRQSHAGMANYANPRQSHAGMTNYDSPRQSHAGMTNYANPRQSHAGMTNYANPRQNHAGMTNYANPRQSHAGMTDRASLENRLGLEARSMDEPVLQEKIAVVTGAGRGIGKAIAVAFGRAGAAVGCAARTASEIEETAREIRDSGGRSLAVPTDVTRPEEVARLFDKTVGQFGGLDILVINAGGNYDRRTVEESRPEDWLVTLNLNLVGAYYCARAAIPHLKRRGAGKIITVGSGMGHRGSAGGSAYACAKAGLWMLTRVLGQELWRDNISVNELIPGPVKTTIDDGRPFSAPGDRRYESEWIKSPEDVTALALFLAAQPDLGPTAQSFSLMRRDD
jgi:3-oxoacyl-[acyl-carrier protein] reductase